MKTMTEHTHIVLARVRRLLLAATLCLAADAATAQDFREHFCDSTLRIDYIFAGSAYEQMIAVDKLNVMPGWYGKRGRLAELPVEGNGQITVTDYVTSEVLYVNSFSTLFQEWLTYEDAATSQRSFENVFLVPMPRHKVDVTVELHDSHRNTTAVLTHTVDPADILIRRVGFDGVTPYRTVVAAADTSRCIHIAYVAEGYTESEMSVFLDDVSRANAALFAHEPFKSMQERFNVVAVMSPSEQSGTSHPAQGDWRRTVLGSHFDTFYSDRYLTTLNLKTLHDVLAGVPYEHIIVLVNTDEYGGGGILNSYNLSMTHHPKFLPVVVHEFGHSFAGLADEYAYADEALPMYPSDTEPWEENITTLVDFGSKWADMLPEGAVEALATGDIAAVNAAGEGAIGLYEGAGYSLTGVYRPCVDCRMRTNENPDFCAVCRRAIRKMIAFYTE